MFSINVNRYLGSMSHLSFLLFFPIFIIYQTLVSNGFLFAILGGYTGIISLFVLLLFLPFSLKIFKQSLNVNLYVSLINFGIFFLALFVTVLSFTFDERYSAVNQSIQLLIFWYGFYCLGLYFFYNGFNNVKKITNLVFLLFFLYMVWYFISTGNLTYKSNIEDFDNESVSSYQSIARNFLACSLFVYSFSSSELKKTIVFFMSIFCLFLIGSRSDLFAMLAGVIFLKIILLLRLKSNVILFPVILLLLIIFFIYVNTNFSDSRQFQIMDFESSSSWQAREYYKEFTLSLIEKSPILGDFGGHTLLGSAGNYSHNFFSAYLNYGLLFLVGYLGLSIYFFLYSLYKVWNMPNCNYWSYCLLLSFICILLICFSKSVFWPLPFFCWGIFMSNLYRENLNRV